MYKVLKEPTKEFGPMNVGLLHSNNQHVSATHVAIFKAMVAIFA